MEGQSAVACIKKNIYTVMKWLKYYPLFLLYEQASRPIQRGTDPYEYKVEADHWMARKKSGGTKWFELSGKDYKPQFQSAIDTLDQENPTLRTPNAPKRKGGQDIDNDIEVHTEPTPTEKPKQLITTPPVSTPTPKITKVDDKFLTKEFNFHLIPDGKNNYRSAQLPIDFNDKQVLSDVIDKYGIQTIIRFNGNNKDGRNKKSHPITSIEDERELAETKGVKFYKLSSTRNQDKVNELLSKGNVLIHCAHGADRTGGNVGGYLYKIGWGDTEKIWDYSTQYSSWKSLIKKNPSEFVKHGYLDQLNKFGVKDMAHATKLANK